MTIIDASSGGNNPLTPGTYSATVVQTSEQVTKAGDGQMVVIELELENGRHIWDRPLFQHATSEGVVRMGLGRLKKLAKAVGEDPAAIDITKLVGKRCMVDLAIQKTNPEYNEVRGYSALNGVATKAPASEAEVTPAKPPWDKTEG